MTNRIDGGRFQPYVEPAPDGPSADTPIASERALRAMAQDRLDGFAAATTSVERSFFTGPGVVPANSRRTSTGATSRGGTSPGRTGATQPTSNPTGDRQDTDDAGSTRRADAAPAQRGEAECPADDYDRCIDRTVANPTLWIAQDTDAHAIDRADVLQRQIGDCYVMAVLAGLTNTSEGRALLQSAITSNTDPTGKVLSYTVTLHHPQPHWFSGTTFTVRQVDVPPIYARGHAEARPGDGHNEVWVPVMERAYAQYSGGYNAMGHGGRIGDAMEIITGRPARTYGLGLIFGRYGPEDLQHDLLNGHLVVVASRNDVEQTRPDLVPNHAYLVTALESQAGKPAVRLWNPWGMLQPALVPFDKLRSLFFQLDVGSAR